MYDFRDSLIDNKKDPDHFKGTFIFIKEFDLSVSVEGGEKFMELFVVVLQELCLKSVVVGVEPR